MGLRIFAQGDVLLGRAALTMAHEGSHGMVHGGAVTALFDELLGCLASHLGMPAVTAHLGVDFRAPVPLPATVELRARCDRVERRKLWVSAEMHLAQTLIAEANGLWIRRPEGA